MSSSLTEASDVSPKARRSLSVLLAATGISVTGDGVLIAAAPLMAAALTREPFQVALVTAAGYLAWPLLGLPAGALVDRWSRRAVMIGADLVRAVVLVALAALTFADLLTIPVLAIGIFLVGVGACFFDPAAQTMIPALIGRDNKEALSRANGKIWAADTFGRSLAGPPLGAILFGAGRAIPFVADAVSFIVSAALVARLPRTPRSVTPHTSLSRSIRDGVAFLAAHPELRVLTLGIGAYNFGYNLSFATLVLFALDVLQVGPLGFGLLIAAMALGGVAGGWIAPKVSNRVPPKVAYALALAAQAGAWLVVMFAGNPWIAGGALAVLGVASTTVSVVGGTARQILTPDDMLGRVVGATRIFGIGAAAAGAVVGGVLADLGGNQAAFLGSVFVLLGFAALFGLAARR